MFSARIRSTRKPRRTMQGREQPGTMVVSDSGLRLAARDALDALESAGVPAALFDTLTSCSPRANIAILIGAHAWSTVDRTLRRIAFARVRESRHAHHRVYIRHDAESGWARLDFVDRLAFGPGQIFDTHATSRALHRRCLADGLRQLDPEDRFWILLLRNALNPSCERRAVGADDRLARMATSVRPVGPLAEALSEVGGGKLRQALVDAVRSGDTPRFRHVARRLCARWVVTYPGETASQLIAHFAIRHAGRLFAPGGTRGLSVALLGPDGVGKTTTARNLQEEMPIGLRVVYMGMYGAAAPRTRGLGLLVRLVRLWRSAAVAMWHQWQGRMVVFDRYTYDALLPARSTVGGTVRRWLLAHSLPKPDVTLLLDAPVEVLRGRQQEQSADELHQQREQYLGLTDRLTRLEVIDATRRPDEVSRAVSRALWQHLTARQHRRSR